MRLCKHAPDTPLGRVCSNAHFAFAQHHIFERGQAFDTDGATGVVTLVITVTPQGALLGVSVAASSGNPVLDGAAVQAVQSARLPKGPAGVDPAGHSFRFRLRYER